MRKKNNAKGKHEVKEMTYQDWTQHFYLNTHTHMHARALQPSLTTQHITPPPFVLLPHPLPVPPPPPLPALSTSVFILLLDYYSCTDCKMYYFVQLY